MVKSKKNKSEKTDPDGMTSNSTEEVEHVKKAVNIKHSISTKSDSGDEDEVPIKPVANNKNNKKKPKGKIQVNTDSEDDEDDDRGATKVVENKRAGGFASLLDDDEYDSDAQDNQEEDDENDDEEIEVKAKPQKPANNDKKAKKPPAKEGKNKANKVDDIDKILMELEKTKIGADGKGDTEESASKTAAQKKKEKKERQKREAALQKDQPKEPVGKEPEVKVEKKAEPEPVAEPEDATAGEAASAADDKKKKKKDKNEKTAKGKKEEEEKEKSRKGPSKNVVAAMQEHLKKMKEEEERLRKEEEEKQILLEEAENLRLENLRLEQEKKERKKQKEKERKERLKAEGKLLSNRQKQDKLRAQAMLEALKAQGVDIPEVGEKRPRPGTRIRTNKKNQSQNSLENQTSMNDKNGEADSSNKDDQPASENDTPTIVKDDVKEAWDASSSSEDEDNDDGNDEVSNLDSSKLQATETSKKSRDTKPSESESIDAENTNETDDDSSDENVNDDDERKQDAEYRRQRVVERIQKRRRDAETKRTIDKLRAAVVCVLGHVDTGKTKILDKLRRTNVQDGEAGGITQQIGATNVPIDVIKEQTKIVKNFSDIVFKLPGLLIIDTPGHESFSNLRSRGSSLCDIAILVVDIMHGLEPQTIESINLLKAKKTPFIVALNKIDRLYDWQTMGKKDVRDIIKSQQANTQLEFEQRTKKIITEFAEQGLNAALFYENPDTRSYVSLVPTSAITGEGMGNLLLLIIESCQNLLAKRLMYSEDLLATVLEVKAIPGLGTTIDAILINGKLREGDTMIVAGTDGPIVTQIRSLLMPQPLKELRVKNAYIEHKEIMAAQGVKIAAKELEKAIAGLNMQVAQKSDEVEILKEEVAKELKSALNSIKLSALGVYVQASTLGSLEALLEFLKASKIPYSGIRIGPVVKRDVMKASTMLTHESQYATILAFDVKIERDAQELADSLGVKIFQADIIYHLFDKFTAYCEDLKQKKRDEFKSIAVFPCKLKILPQFVFNSRDPIVMGVIVEAGILKEGTPICVPTKEFVELGIITSIESNHKQIPTARKGQEVCIKIDPLPGEAPKMFGRHFDDTDFLVSKITRQSIDACKEYFRDDLVKTDWALMVELKKQFQIL